MNEYYAMKVERQKKEIETIKERTITLKLSDADCERISKMAGSHGLTVGELFENFIGDLVDGTYSNGSDEREKANEWFDRCWFGMFPTESLIQYFLDTDQDVDDFICVCDELKYFGEHPEEFENDIETLWFKEDYENYIRPFMSRHPEADIEKEIDQCRKWFADLEAFRGITE